MRIKKILIWRNPTPISPRWDMEIVYENGSRGRVIKTDKETVIKIVEQAFS